MKQPPSDGPAGADRLVPLGRIGGVHGVRGWLKVRSGTEPREAIARYRSWLVCRPEGWQPMQVEAAQWQGPALLVKLSGVCDREQARALVGSEIAVHRRDLPEPEADRFYWSDLEGLTVRTLDGQPLGRVERLFETGANDVLVVRGERERLLPFVYGTVVRQVDLNAGEIRVDWDPDF